MGEGGGGCSNPKAALVGTGGSSITGAAMPGPLPPAQIKQEFCGVRVWGGNMARVRITRISPGMDSPDPRTARAGVVVVAGSV